jgi:hypothetical protein
MFPPTGGNDDDDNGNVEMKFDEEEDMNDLPTNHNIGIMGRNNQNSFLPKKGEKQSQSWNLSTSRS